MLGSRLGTPNARRKTSSAFRTPTGRRSSNRVRPPMYSGCFRSSPARQTSKALLEARVRAAPFDDRLTDRDVERPAITYQIDVGVAIDLRFQGVEELGIQLPDIDLFHAMDRPRRRLFT